MKTNQTTEEALNEGFHMLALEERLETVQIAVEAAWSSDGGACCSADCNDKA